MSEEPNPFNNKTDYLDDEDQEFKNTKHDFPIPSQDPRFEEYLDLQDNLDPLVILHIVNIDRKNRRHTPFFITLMVNEIFLHNCMLETSASTNFMFLMVMNQLGLKITRPYRNMCGIASRAIPICGIIKDLKVSLVAYPDISLIMDVVVIYVSDGW
jgi:hypothetical protein